MTMWCVMVVCNSKYTIFYLGIVNWDNDLGAGEGLFFHWRRPVLPNSSEANIPLAELSQQDIDNEETQLFILSVPVGRWDAGSQQVFGEDIYILAKKGS